MSNNSQQPERPENLSRREFMRDGATAAAGLAVGMGAMGNQQAHAAEAAKTRSYNPDMEYRPLGKTGLWVSAVCMGGHWKRIEKMAPKALKGNNWLAADLNDEGFKKNRRDVVTRCIESGINYIDACTKEEVMAYAEALRGRREKMYFGFSWYESELRFPDWRTKEKLIEGFDNGLRQAKLDYADVWRVSALMTEPQPDADMEAMVEAFEVLHGQGKVRFLGLSSHHHEFLKHAIETWPQISVILFPYTANSKELPQDSLFDAIRAQDVGAFGIKPFSSNSLFKGSSQLDSPVATEDDELARLTIRYILGNPAVTAPIPGLINTHQVENVALAVREHRQLDVGEQARLRQATEEMSASLPPEYHWLRDWEWV